MPRLPLLAALVTSLVLVVAPASSLAFRIPADLGPIAGDPANRLASVPIDPEVYDPATHCDPAPHKGVVAAISWLEHHTSGVSWGTYRCEKWGPHSASLHAENRAIDWHPSTRAAARKLIELLLAPDRDGNQHALARRMGIEELIWQCSYWGAGAQNFEDYSYCYTRSGKRKHHLDPTAAHMNHVHIGFSKRGARGQTSFWRWMKETGH
ncbi:MAG: hypothetical protein JWM71_94 [Solirubrobacteraceae bacterium]|nr:hypothetical protein [Solirubrobacteraceae bacterium]